MSMADEHTAAEALPLIWQRCLQTQHEGRLRNTHPSPCSTYYLTN